MGRGYIVVTRELISAALRLPPNTDVYGAEWDFLMDGVKIYIASPDLAEQPEGAHPLRVNYTTETTSRFLRD